MQSVSKNLPTALMLAIQAAIFFAVNRGIFTAEQALALSALLGTGAMPVVHRMQPPATKAAETVAKVAIVLCLTGCAGLRDTVAAVAPLADPLLRAIGFCQEHAPKDRVDAILEAYRAGDKMAAAMKTALLMQDIRAAGVEVPPSAALDMVETIAALEGLQEGLRALSCRDPKTGAPVPGCAP